MFSFSLSAQQVQFIKLNQNIKDKFSRTKSLTLIDNRADKNLGTVTHKGETVQMKFSEEDLKNYVETWFAGDNKTRGNNDITLLLEEIKIDDFKNTGLTKVKIKISSFINRNGKYYFINRYNSSMDFNSKITPNIPKTVSSTIETVFSSLINDSYAHIAFSTPILESEINNYETIVGKNIKFLNAPELTNGVYKDFRSLSLQKPEPGYYIEKNKKGKVTGVKNSENLLLSSEYVFAYIEDGKIFRLTPVGFLEMQKDDKGYFVFSSRLELFPPQNANTGAMIGAMTGGLVGALIGAALDSGTGRRDNSNNLSNIYIDQLTGEYTFEK
jgi:hypothetical protein